MSGTKSPAGKAGKQSARHFQVAPVTRAVRMALAATTLALVGTGAAHAGTCTASANATTCTGSFIDTLSFPDAVDLTLVVGDGATPTSVTPGAGAPGIDVVGDGAIDITSNASISTYGADGIHAYSAGSTHVTNNGDITTYVAGVGQEAIDASANGDVTVDNHGAVTAYGYGSYDVTAVRAETVGCGCTASVDNGADGSIIASATDGSAVGIYAYAGAGQVDVDNGGYIGAFSRNGLADGIFAAGVDADVHTTGTIVAEGYAWAAGVEAEGSDLTTVRNDGTLYAYAQASGGQAFGIYAAGGDGGTTVDNTGAITAIGYYATGIDASATGHVGVTNTGGITIADSLIGTGIHAASNGDGGSVDVVNGGDLTIHSYYGSTGIEVLATGAGATGTASNTGSITAMQTSKYGSSVGIVVSADGDAHIDNSGSIYVVQGTGGAPLRASQGFTPYYGGSAYGAMALSFNGDASITNSGEIQVVSMPSGYAAGIVAASQNGNASVSNSGSVTSVAKYAYGIMATSAGGDVNITNSVDGTVYAASPIGLPYSFASALAGIATSGDVSIDNAGMAYALAHGVAVGTLGISSQGNVTETNSGAMGAYSYGALAIGMFARADYGTANIDNSGQVQAYSYYGDAVGLLARGDTANAGNSGSIQAYGYSSAYGIEAAGTTLASISNDGDIVAYSSNGVAIGVFGVSSAGDVTITGSGNVSTYGAQAAIGLYAYAAGTASVTNDGSIQAYSWNGIAEGIFAAGADVHATSNGDIAVEAYGFAAGIEAHGDTVSVANTGSLTAKSDSAYAFGVYANGATAVNVSNSGYLAAIGSRGGYGLYVAGGDLVVDNSGDILATGNNAFGIHAYSDAEGSASSLSNEGSVTAAGSNYSIGMGLFSAGVGATGSISNTGTLYASSNDKYGESAGMVVRGDGDVLADNTGSIEVHGGRMGYGALAVSGSGSAVLTNEGDVLVTAGMLGHGIGLGAETGSGVASVYNSGSVSVESKYAFGILASSYDGDASIHNAVGGEVHAYATGAFAHGLTGTSQYGNVDVINDGNVFASAPQNAVGIATMSYHGGDVHVANTGNVTAYSPGGQAIGATVLTDTGVASLDNTGSLQATTMYGPALGAVVLGDTVHATNGGDVTALTHAGNAYGLVLQGHTSVDIGNTGTITAHATYGNAVAAGLVAYSEGTLHVTNAGTISAVGDVTGNVSIGLSAVAYGLVQVDNAGLITASHPDYAVAVSLDSATGSILTNTGSIRVDAPVEGQVAVHGGDWIENVLNYGELDGALVLNGGDDLVFNGAHGVWNVGNHTTDFGNGDDRLVNGTGGLVNLTDASVAFGDGDDAVVNGTGGTLLLHGGAISLGSSDATGNSFTNNGTIRVVGGGNTIDMGTGPAALVPSLNPLPLVNNGVIDFVDGAPDDVLTIAGDLDGHGRIQVDLRPLTHASDMLYVDGSVANGAVQLVDVDFGVMPTSAMLSGTTAFAHVTGNSAAGSFVAGRVLGYDPSNFINLQVNVTSQIDASGAVADVFSVGVQAAGLSNTGSVAAALAPGAQSMVNSLIGTWRQRTGVQVDKGTIGVSPWFRMFSDRGSISPEQVASNFGDGGAFGFDEANSGWELGLDVRPFDQIHVGLLLGESDGNQRLANTGSGDVGGQTFGLYGTWIGDKGFYVDTSFRWTGLTGRVRADGTQQYTDGEADSFNIEAGFGAWSLPGDVLIQPQVQYTHTSLDFHPLVADLTTFDGRSANSSRGRVGILFSKTIANGGWTWMPYGSVNAIREFDGEYTYAINDDFVGTTRTKGTSALVELGLGMHKDKLTVSGGLNWTDGGALNSFFGGQLVLRTTW